MRLSFAVLASHQPSRYLLDDHDDDPCHDDDEPNEYEDDGFLVDGSHDSDVEEVFDSHDEDDNDDGECQICKNGGDLMVCDGGDHEGGCCNAYHIHCIGRNIVPPGEFKKKLLIFILSILSITLFI